MSQPRGFRQIIVLVGIAIFLLAFCQPGSANVIYVTTLTDKVSTTGGCSLKEAIYSSTLHDTLDGIHGIAIDYTIPDHFITTGCEIGSGNDTIILPTGSIPPTFQLLTDTSWDAHNPYGPTATPIINSNITIQGYGATLQWAGAGHARLFAVGPATITTPNGVSSGTGNLTLQNVHITGFYAKGGNGTDGGGGGLGAGGAVYVQSGGLTVENSTFESNVATGGNGGGNYGGGGGGGGLGGNGGNAPNTLGGGGGGGARGNGGDGPNAGGGGGGTVNNGATSAPLTSPNGAGGPGGYLCGGDGGNTSGRGGDNGTCPGGGGGGAGYDEGGSVIQSSSGGTGAYGGGGGGGTVTGGNGGFGGGGGSVTGFSGEADGQGGNGGFGAGGGMASITDFYTGGPGQGGAFGGNADAYNGGGGGAALGGAVFSDSGEIVIKNSTFYNNSLFDGRGGSNYGVNAENGSAAGAIFARDGSLTIIDSTISGNQADGAAAGVVVYGDSAARFTLNNTIIANNGANECYVNGSVTVSGTGNLIMSNGAGGSFGACPGVVVTADPQLGPLQLNSPGITPTMAISTSSSAFNAADPTTSLSTDQRGVDRPQDGGFDIGAYEACAPPHVFGGLTCVILTKAPPPVTVPLTIEVSPAGGGTTSPAAGTTDENEGSAVIATATPNPGYYFGEWFDSLGNLLTTESSAGVVMNSPVTIEAVFFPCGCAADVTSSVTVTRGPIVLNPVSKHYAQSVTVKNNTANTLMAPISLVLQNLTESVALNNESGVTAYVMPRLSPFVSSNVSLAPGQSTFFTLQFENPTNAAISYTTRVVSGPGVI